MITERFVRLDIVPALNRQGMITITVDADTTHYLLEPYLAYFGMRGFRLTKISARIDTEIYHVLIDTTNTGYSMCDCKGFRRWFHCKHVSGLRKLIQENRL